MATSHPALAPFLERLTLTDPSPVGEAGLGRCQLNSDALDAALAELAAETDSSFSVVAVGGYGRREQSRHSDVDLMLLVPRGGDEASATRLLYPLWDAGLKVGHSVRTLGEVPDAAEHIETFTALLDARFVAGDPELFAQLEVVLASLARSRQRHLLAGLRERHETLQRAQPWQLQAADLKNARGGLRQLQFIHWLARAAQRASGEVGEPLPPDLRLVRERLLATRQAVHALEERPGDIFRDDLASRVAEWLGEETLECARALYLAMREVDRAATTRFEPTAAKRRWWQRRQRPADPGADPAPAPASTASGDLEALRAALRAVANEAVSPPLDPLPRASWLERLLPEWEALRARRHIAPFHTHPVDTHLLRTVAEAAYIAQIDDDRSGTVEVAAAVGDLDDVLLAAFLHDVGKGREEEHSTAGAVIAERFCARAGLDAATTQRLTTVVRHHLLLPSVATRRDIADPRVINEVAEAVGTPRILHLLYLVAVADSRATGPDVWSAWKAQLMRSLYDRVLAVLLEIGAEALSTERSLERAQRALVGRFSAEAIAAHASQLEPGYLLSTPPDTVGDHLELVNQALADGVGIRRDELKGMDRLTIVCRDRPGLLQILAGTLAAHQANVLGGVAYTRADGIAIEVWHVGDALGHEIDDRRWSRIIEAVPAALDGSYPLEERLAQVRRMYPAPPSRLTPSVHVENAASDAFSVLEVTAQDRPGLLHAITHALHEFGIDIHLAKVDTLGPEVFDAFYIQRQNGRRIEDPDEIQRLARRVLDAIAALEPE